MDNWVCRQPSVVEIQILRVGQFVILCVPGELTTMAGRRLREAVQASVSTPQCTLAPCAVALLCCAALRCAVLHRAVLHRAVLGWAGLCCCHAVLCRAVLCCAALCCVGHNIKVEIQNGCVIESVLCTSGSNEDSLVDVTVIMRASQG